MAKLQSLQKIRDIVRGQIMAENLAKQSNGNTQQLINALAVVPETQMLSLIHWLHDSFLPKVKSKLGEENEEFKQFVRIRDSIVWALHILHQYELQQLKNVKDYQLLGYYIERAAFLERELLKYTTAEQMLMYDAVDIYRKGAVSRAFDILEQEPGVKPGAPANT